MKCEKCIWSDRRPGNKIVCPFSRCVYGDGWTEKSKKGVDKDG